MKPGEKIRIYYGKCNECGAIFQENKPKANMMIVKCPECRTGQVVFFSDDSDVGLTLQSEIVDYIKGLRS
jgi:ribosomal protein S27E